MTLRPILLSSIATLVLAACATADSAAPPAAVAAGVAADPAAPAAAPAKAALGSYGFDDSGMDRAIAPGDDFYNYANGAWARATAIPADKSNYGMFTALDDLSKERVKGILEATKDDANSKVGMAYASYLDTAAVEAKGLEPIRPWMAKVKAATTRDAVTAMYPELARAGIPSFVGSYVGQDDKNPDAYILSVAQAGTGLPDRDMYIVRNAKFDAIRAAYVAHLAKMLTLAGEPDAAGRAAAVMAMETKIAQVQWTREDSSDSAKTYNRMTIAKLDASAPALGLKRSFAAIAPGATEVVVNQPSAIAGISRIVAATPVAVLRDATLLRGLDTYSDVLPDALANETFAFYGTTLSGTPQREERWKRGVGFVEGAMGEEVGREYAARYFPAETKAAMGELVKNVLGAMDRRIENLAWMQPATRARAHAKLANFTVKIGYPDRWKDYGALEIRRDDLFGNQWRANQWAFDDNVAKLGQPIRRWEWGMLPQTVNAYANFSMMEVVFPAAILQPPFFDPNADPAINYGGIGAVIGHEISHHFDDQGAKYDEKGRLADWWTPADLKAFEASGKALVAQYDAYQPLPGENLKGEFTLGENIGDLAGLTIAYDAYRASLNGKEPPVIDGMTGDQRFFLGWAQVWRRNYREANLRQRLLTDPHSPSQQRAWVVRNLDKWYEAFQPKPGDKLYLAPEARVRIW